jgi:hypothetical protein
MERNIKLCEFMENNALVKEAITLQNAEHYLFFYVMRGKNKPKN